MLWRILNVNSHLILESVSQRGLYFLKTKTKKIIAFHTQDSSSVGLLNWDSGLLGWKPVFLTSPDSRILWAGGRTIIYKWYFFLSFFSIFIFWYWRSTHDLALAGRYLCHWAESQAQTIFLKRSSFCFTLKEFCPRINYRTLRQSKAKSGTCTLRSLSPSPSQLPFAFLSACEENYHQLLVCCQSPS